MPLDTRMLDTRPPALVPSQTAWLGTLSVQSVRPYNQEDSRFPKQSIRRTDTLTPLQRRHAICDSARVNFAYWFTKEKNGYTARHSICATARTTVGARSLEKGNGNVGGGDSPASDVRTKHEWTIRTSSVWSGREDLNLRPLRPERNALPGCATPRLKEPNRHARGDCLTSEGQNASHAHRPLPGK